MALVWNDELGTGITDIDEQHKKVIEWINRIDRTFDEETGAEAFDSVVRFFGGFVLDHFKTEEEYMILHNYPDYDEHKGEHMAFLKKLASLKRLLEKEESAPLIALVIKNEYVEWFKDHQMNDNKKLADFLRQQP